MLQRTPLVKTYYDVKQRVEKAKRNRVPVLVAVSKTKPTSDIQELYDEGHRDFGENYVDEFVTKAGKLPDDIKWHFIGHLQSNKAAKVVKVKNLHVLETLDSPKLATKLHNACVRIGRKNLKVFLQVNTSGEAQKSGISNFSGLMTIGMFASKAEDSKPFFLSLVEYRKKLIHKCNEDKIDPGDLELSMGMSTDYELAIELGSTNVRVGSGIFGRRVYKK